MSAVLLTPSQHAAWAADPLWRRARQRPAFDIDFTQGTTRDRINNITPTFSRTASSKNVWNGSSFVSVAADTPAFQWDTASGRWGYLHEPAATNLFLNSGSPATQNITVTAQAYTLSFYGTGTITLSGASTAGPLVGTGAEPTRVSLTFTPSAGTLTLTVSGTITRPQLETGSVATSPITTTGSTVTRSADLMTASGGDFSRWYDQRGGTWYWEGASLDTSATTRGCFAVEASATPAADFIRVFRQSDSQPVFQSLTASATEFVIGAGATWTTTATRRLALRHASNNAQAAVDATLTTADASVNMATYDRLRIGSLNNGGAPFVGLIYRLAYFPPGPAQTRLQELTRP